MTTQRKWQYAGLLATAFVGIAGLMTTLALIILGTNALYRFFFAWPIFADQAEVSVPRISCSLPELKNTPMAEAVPHICAAARYYDLNPQIFIGIANAESSFKRFRCFNPWGIDTGKGNDPRCYNSWAHSVNGFAQLIKYSYIERGLDTPERMLTTYVGWNNPDWLVNVRAYWKQ